MSFEKYESEHRSRWPIAAVGVLIGSLATVSCSADSPLMPNDVTDFLSENVRCQVSDDGKTIRAELDPDRLHIVEQEKSRKINYQLWVVAAENGTVYQYAPIGQFSPDGVATITLESSKQVNVGVQPIVKITDEIVFSGDVIACDGSWPDTRRK